MGKKSKDYICPCYKITKQDLKDYIKDGYSSFKDLKKDTNIGKSCSSCKKKNKKRFEKYYEQYNAQT